MQSPSQYQFVNISKLVLKCIWRDRKGREEPTQTEGKDPCWRTVPLLLFKTSYKAVVTPVAGHQKKE